MRLVVMAWIFARLGSLVGFDCEVPRLWGSVNLSIPLDEVMGPAVLGVTEVISLDWGAD